MLKVKWWKIALLSIENWESYESSRGRTDKKYDIIQKQTSVESSRNRCKATNTSNCHNLYIFLRKLVYSENICCTNDTFGKVSPYILYILSFFSFDTNACLCVCEFECPDLLYVFPFIKHFTHTHEYSSTFVLAVLNKCYCHIIFFYFLSFSFIHLFFGK